MPVEERAFADARRHAIYQIAHAPLRTYPFPHVFVEDILPAGFYGRLLANLPGIRAYDRDEGAVAEHVEGRRSIKGARRGCNRMDAERAGFWTAAFEAFAEARHPGLGGFIARKVRQPATLDVAGALQADAQQVVGGGVLGFGGNGGAGGGERGGGVAPAQGLGDVSKHGSLQAGAETAIVAAPAAPAAASSRSATQRSA